MNKKMIAVNYYLIVLLSLCTFLFSSCTKKSENLSQKEASKPIENAEKIDQNDLNETAVDLLNVDYKQFYDELSPHGQWVQVKASDIGVDLSKMNKSESSALIKDRNSFLNFLTGINSAYADADVDMGMFFVWQPSPDLAISVAASTDDEVSPAGYTPYANGEWINSDDGWYFAAATPYEDVTCHYGRWAYTDDMGWVWLPGRVWAPAWVDWREDDDYICWAPMGPGSCIVDNVIYDPYPVVVDRYYECDKRYFCDPDCYRHMIWDREHRDRIDDMRRIEGISVVNNNVFNRGPLVSNIETKAGRQFTPVNINRVDNINNVNVENNKINTFSPHFVKDAGNNSRTVPVSQPKSFKQFADVKNTKNQDNAQSQQNGSKNDNKTGITQKENVNGNTTGKNNNSNVQKFSNKNYNKSQGNNVNKQNWKSRNKTNTGKNYKGSNNTGNTKSNQTHSNGKNKSYNYNGNNNKSYNNGNRNNNTYKGSRNNGNTYRGNTNNGNTNKGNTNKGNTNKGNTNKGNNNNQPRGNNDNKRKH